MQKLWNNPVSIVVTHALTHTCNVEILNSSNLGLQLKGTVNKIKLLNEFRGFELVTALVLRLKNTEWWCDEVQHF